MPEVTVVVPTFRRPEDLERAVLSVFEQIDVSAFDLLIVDNDPDASARSVSETLMTQAPSFCSMSYIHEPNAGVANARNTALTNTHTNLIAFLDDDQSAPPHWLSELISFHKKCPAPVTFGPVVTRLPETTSRHRPYLETFFARSLDRRSGQIEHYYGCGNSFFDLSLIGQEKPLFDTAMNETGGEDDMLFRSLQESGYTFGWCAEAPAYEHVPASRATLRYTLKRAFSYGQGPITLARTATPRKNGMVLLWMLVGAGKALLNTTFYVGSWLVQSPSRATYLDRAIRGAGKVFWWVDFRFYGASALPEASAK